MAFYTLTFWLIGVYLIGGPSSTNRTRAKRPSSCSPDAPLLVKAAPSQPPKIRIRNRLFLSHVPAVPPPGLQVPPQLSSGNPPTQPLFPPPGLLPSLLSPGHLSGSRKTLLMHIARRVTSRP